MTILFRCFVDNNGMFEPVTNVDTAGSVRAEIFAEQGNKFVGTSAFFFLGQIRFKA